MASEADLIKLQETLYTSANPTRRWLHCTRRDWIKNALHRYSLINRGRALEVGPGSGIYLPVLAHLFHEVIAMDLEPVFLEHAKTFTGTYPNIHLILGSITKADFLDNHFDLILCTEVIEHIANSFAAFKEMYRLLKPGGILVCSTPQRYSTLELMGKIAFKPGIINLIRLIYREPILETGHINLMTEKQLWDQMESAGFQIREYFKSGLYLPLIAEFMGSFGLRLEQWLESKLCHGPFEGLLWTQYYIAVKEEKKAVVNH